MQTESQLLALFGPIGMPEMVVIAALGLLIFGRKLPEVGRSVGRSIVEFKRGLADVKDDIDKTSKELPTVSDVVPKSAPENAVAPPTDRKADSPASPS